MDFESEPEAAGRFEIGGSTLPPRQSHCLNLSGTAVGDYIPSLMSYHVYKLWTARLSGFSVWLWYQRFCSGGEAILFTLSANCRRAG